MAMAVCMTAFPAVLFLCFQDKMIGGVKIGGIKG
jgi:ABC-type glycerol-3-phosphate transport system permease component